MHIITLVESDPRYFKKFEEWINSRNYGCRPYCREIKLYDLNIKKIKLKEFLADLKNYQYGGSDKPIPFNKSAWKIVTHFVKLLRKILKLKPINMDGIKTSGNKCKGIPWLYLYPVGYIEDRFHKNDEVI